MKKGSKCAVVGRLQNSSYEASDGTKRYTTDVIADEVEFLSAKTGDAGAEEKTTAPKATKPAELEPIDDDDSLPF